MKPYKDNTGADSVNAASAPGVNDENSAASVAPESGTAETVSESGTTDVPPVVDMASAPSENDTSGSQPEMSGDVAGVPDGVPMKAKSVRRAAKKQRPKKKKRIRLFSQLLFSFLLLTFATSIIIALLSSSLIRSYVQRSTLETLADNASVIADMVVRPGGSLRVINVQQMDEWEKLTNAQLIFVDSDMQLITRQTVRNSRMTITADRSSRDGSSGTDELLSSIDYELLNSLLKGNVVADVRTFDFMEGTWLFAGTPIVNTDNDVDGAVLLCRALSETDYVTWSIYYIVVAALGISVVLSVLISLLLTRRITRPISAMRDTALKMANGQYGERVRANVGTAETAQLGDALNRLSANLATNIRSLQQEKDKMALILSGIGEGIVAVDQSNRFIHCNEVAQSLLELSDADTRRTLPELTGRSPIIEMLQKAMQTGESAMGSWKNGAGVSAAATVSPIKTAGDIVGAVGLVRDISEAERLEQLRRDYVANISHELRTPLTGIRGMVEPLIDGVYDTEEERMDSYRVIHQETLRLERLITDMLDISRLQDGRIRLELEPMKVAGMLEAAKRRQLNRAKDQNVNVIVDAAEDPLVLGDEDRIMQVLIILLDNALKFTPPGGTITLSTQRAPDGLTISVQDTGPGVAKGDLPYIFERFYKADKSREQTKGTGLGLAIARLVVDLMGGVIWCESEPGRGAAFKFTLKLASEEE